MKAGRHRWCASVALAALLVAGCGDGSSQPHPEAVGDSGYAALIDWAARLESSEFVDGSPVFVVGLGEVGLPIDTQVKVIGELAGVVDVRFVDDYVAVLDAALADSPVDDAGLVVGVATIPREAPFVVRVETYRSSVARKAYLATLRMVSGRWTVDAHEMVEPEGLLAQD